MCSRWWCKWTRRRSTTTAASPSWPSGPAPTSRGETTMKILFAVALAATLGGCDDDVTTMMNPDLSASGFPTAPTIGAQLDRMGRPAINTALTDPFYTDKTMHEGKL